MTAARTLLLAPVDLLNGRTSSFGDLPLALVTLPPCPFDEAPNSIVLDLPADTPLEVAVPGRGTATVPAGSLFEHLRPAPALAALFDGAATVGSLVPAFVVRDDLDGRHLYSQIRFALEDALFVRTTEKPVATEPVEDLAWVPDAVARHAEHALFLNNHQRYYRKCLADSEVEVKFTLDGAVDIWDLTADAYRRIDTGDMAGYVPEYRDEFQQWDFPTRLYEVTDPERPGYISFIPTPDGRHLVKQKQFAADCLVRKESISGAQRLPGTTEDFIRHSVGDAYRKLPAVRRVRYDVNFESMPSGHVYGIFFDRVSVIGAPHVAMSQCEVEYLRSRTAIAPDPDRMFRELEGILAWIRAFLDERGVDYVEGYYSKLSFLRDALADGRVVGDPSTGTLE